LSFQRSQQHRNFQQHEFIGGGGGVPADHQFTQQPGLFDNPIDFLNDQTFFGVSAGPTSTTTGDLTSTSTGDIDWTALGLDCFGTQLVLPQGQQQQQHLPNDFGLVLGSHDTLASNLEQDPLDLLFADTEMTGGLNQHSESGDHLFNRLLNHSPQEFPPSSGTNDTQVTTPAIPSTRVATTNTTTSTSPSHSSTSESNTRPTLDQDPTAKRQRNTMAARRYRQRRLDRLAELEKKLEEMTSERDDLRVKLARREAECGALREVLGSKK